MVINGSSLPSEVMPYLIIIIIIIIITIIIAYFFYSDPSKEFVGRFTIKKKLQYLKKVNSTTFLK